MALLPPIQKSKIKNHQSSIHPPAAGGSSYGQILRSSSTIGGATEINYVIGCGSIALTVTQSQDSKNQR